MSFLSDHELFERIIQRDTSAFELLYDRYERVLYLTALRLTNRAELAEAALLEVFTDLWRAPQTFDIQITSLRLRLFARAETAARQLLQSA